MLLGRQLYLNDRNCNQDKNGEARANSQIKEKPFIAAVLFTPYLQWRPISSAHCADPYLS